MSLILPPTYVDHTAGINERVRGGDPETGWRGDPDMVVCKEPRTSPLQVQVWGWDFEGTPYLAARVEPDRDPDWRRTLLGKLRDGDWQRGKVTQDLDEADRARREALREARREIEDDAKERLWWSVRRDLGVKDFHSFAGLR